MGVVLRIGACVSAFVVAAPLTAAAEPLVREHYSFEGSETFVDDECGAPIEIDHAFEGGGVFMLKHGRRGDATPYYFDNYWGVETFTNPVNQKTATLTHQGLFKDLQIVHVEGTIYQFTAIETGRPIVVRGPSGEVLVFDAGRIEYVSTIDTKGDADLSNDEFLSFDGDSVAGPHPIYFGEADFCDLLDLLR